MSKYEYNRKMLEEFALDFVVNEMKRDELTSKYKISEAIYYEIVKRMQLIRKKETYHRKVLDKSLERCATYQSKIIYKATELLNNHVELLSQRQREQAKTMLTSTEIRDVLAILAIIAKEARLDNGEATDRIIERVQVMFPEGFRPIISKPIEAECVESKSIKEPKKIEEPEEEVTVEIDNGIIGSPLG